MMGARNVKAPKETAPKRATGGQGKDISSDTGARKGGKPITIPLSDVSPELKAILVKEMIKGGRAKVVKGKGKGKVKRVFVDSFDVNFACMIFCRSK